MVKLRTVEQAYQDIKALDANSSVTRNYIRTIANSNIIPVKKVGKKLLIDMECLEAYLADKGGTD